MVTPTNPATAQQQAIWATGDFSVIGTRIVIVSELLLEAVDPRAGWKVLDVATGSGNTALAAARRDCEVTGVDFVPALLERARERAQAERLTIEFREGDAQRLPVEDGAYDAVLSTFGAMFAPDQQQTADELLRATRPGGIIGMANWIPGGAAAEVIRLSSRHLPPPTTAPAPPPLWGTEARLRELFGDRIADLRITPRTVRFRYRSPEAYIDEFRAFFGPVRTAFEWLDAAEQERLRTDIIATLRQHNVSGDGTLALDSAYLEMVATKR